MSKRLTETKRVLREYYARNQAAVAIENARLHEEVRQELAERKRAESGLRESEARLAETQRLARKSTAASNALLKKFGLSRANRPSATANAVVASVL